MYGPLDGGMVTVILQLCLYSIEVEFYFSKTKSLFKLHFEG